MKISEMMEVFQAGKEVANAAAWKNGTIKANTIMVLLSGLVFVINMFDCSICNMHLTPEQLVGLATGIMTVAGIFNTGSTMATSSKVGITPTKKKLVESSLNDDIEKLQ